MNEVSIPKALFFNTNVTTNRNAGLDVLRACCLFAIILGHTNNYLKHHTQVFWIIYPLLIIAQELFFGLSGFLIGNQIIKSVNNTNKYRLVKFYSNRFIRTLPFYYIFLIINFLVFSFYYNHQTILSFLHIEKLKIWHYPLLIQNLYWPAQSFFPEMWALTVEEFSFLFLPIPIYLLTKKLNRPLNFKTITSILLIIIFAMLIWRLWYVVTNNPDTDWGLRKITLLRLDALAYGFIMRLFIIRFPQLFSKFRIILCLTGGLSALLFYMSVNLIPELYYKSLLFSVLPLFSSLMLPFFFFQDFAKLISKKIMALFTHFSITSYGVLLSHLYLVQFTMLTIYFPKNLSHGLLFTAIYFVIIFTIGTLFFNYIERPILGKRKKLYRFSN